MRFAISLVLEGRIGAIGGYAPFKDGILMDSQAWLCCTISPGQFSGEYAVEGEMFDGEGFSLFANEEHLECKRFPLESERASAWIQVQVLEQDRGLMLVRLPSQTLENGQTVTVAATSVKFSPSKQQA